MTDAELRADLQAGLKPAQIAEKHGVTRQAVYKRVNQLQLTTTSAVVAPQESKRFVRHQIDVMGQLSHNLGRVNLLFDACDEWLRSAEDPSRYEVGPRSEEIQVTYRVLVEAGEDRNGNPKFREEKRRAPLSTLLALVKDPKGDPVVGVEYSETKHADPRELVLKTCQEARATATTFAELIQKLIDSQTMEAWRKAVLEEIAQESPDCARRIAERVQRQIVLYAAFDGPAAVLAGGSVQ